MNNLQINEFIRESFSSTPLLSYKRTKQLEAIVGGKTVTDEKVKKNLKINTEKKENIPQINNSYIILLKSKNFKKIFCPLLQTQF